MILLRHAKRIAHDSGRGMALPGLYSGRFLFCEQHDELIQIGQRLKATLAEGASA